MNSAISRHSLARGTARAAPAAMTAISAPVLAASSPCAPVSLAVGQQTTLGWDAGWVETVDPTRFVAGPGTLAGAPVTVSLRLSVTSAGGRHS